MMVVDVMVITYFLLRHPTFTEEVDRVFESPDAVCAPPLWKSEFRNVLLQYVRAAQSGTWESGFTVEEALRIIRDAEQLLDATTFDVSSTEILQLAHASGCSAYDCEYVALAQELDAALVTYDRAVLAAFPEVAKHPREFGG